MTFAPYQPELLTHGHHHTCLLRRNARIKSSKLPSDFFQVGPVTPFTPRTVGSDISNRDLQTPSFKCRGRYSSISRETTAE